VKDELTVSSHKRFFLITGKKVGGGEIYY